MKESVSTKMSTRELKLLKAGHFYRKMSYLLFSSRKKPECVISLQRFWHFPKKK